MHSLDVYELTTEINKLQKQLITTNDLLLETVKKHKDTYERLRSRVERLEMKVLYTDE